MDLTDSNEDMPNETDKGKEKIGEKKDKEHIGEKRKASQDNPKPHKRPKMKAHKQPIEPQLGVDDYENIATYVQETIESLMTAIVNSHTALKRTIDIEIVGLKTLLE